MKITLITGCRDRDINRIKRSLDSLQKQSYQDFQMLFIDYGSSKENSIRFQKLLASYPFCRYYYSDTRGWLWNRASALNIGAKLATTKYLVFTDIDSVYDVDFFLELSNTMKEDIFLISDFARVPKDFQDWENILDGKYKHSFNSMKGKGIACYSKKIFEEIGGFDEQYAYWGREDIDIAQRMEHYGIREVFGKNLFTYHQWHPQTQVSAPQSVVFHNISHYYESIKKNNICANQNKAWGKITTQEDRPIYTYVDPEKRALRSIESVNFRDAYNISNAEKWADEIVNLRSSVWALPKNKPIGQRIIWVNKFLRRLYFRLDRSISYLDDFAQGLVVSVPGFFTDYYLDCSIGSKNIYSIFLV